MNTVSTSLLMLLCFGPPMTAQTIDNVITIDGAKNPELIPAWAAWQHAFLIMAGPTVHGDLPIPTSVWRVTTPQERDAIRKAALDTIANERRVGAEALKLRDGLNDDNLKQRMEGVQAYEMTRRRLVLEVRDRLLTALSLPAQTALQAFVEVDCKKGYRVSLLKSQLDQFRLPE